MPKPTPAQRERRRQRKEARRRHRAEAQLAQALGLPETTALSKVKLAITGTVSNPTTPPEEVTN